MQLLCFQRDVCTSLRICNYSLDDNGGRIPYLCWMELKICWMERLTHHYLHILERHHGILPMLNLFGRSLVEYGNPPSATVRYVFYYCWGSLGYMFIDDGEEGWFERGLDDFSELFHLRNMTKKINEKESKVSEDSWVWEEAYSSWRKVLQ